VVFYALSATPMSRESIQTLVSMVSEVESKQIYFKHAHGPNEKLLVSKKETGAPELKETESVLLESQATDQASESPVTAATPINEEKLADKDALQPLTDPTSDSAEVSKSVAEQTPAPLAPTTPAPKPEPTSLTEDLNALSPQAREIADLGTKLYQDKRFFDAVIIFRRALKVAPDNLFVIAHVAIAKIQVGKITDARVGLEKVLLKKPKDLLVLTNLAIVYSRLKAYDKAIATLKQILEIDPQNAIAHHDMGVVLGKTGELKESEQYLLRSIALDPNYAKAHLNLASMYLQQTPPALDLARASYEKAKSLGCAADSKIESRLHSP